MTFVKVLCNIHFLKLSLDSFLTEETFESNEAFSQFEPDFGKVFKDGVSKICGRQPLKIWSDLLASGDQIISNFLRLSSTKFIWSILEYLAQFGNKVQLKTEIKLINELWYLTGGKLVNLRILTGVISFTLAFFIRLACCHRIFIIIAFFYYDDLKVYQCLKSCRSCSVIFCLLFVLRAENHLVPVKQFSGRL